MYKIYYSDILSYGYIKVSIFKKSGATNLPATKFKFKIIAILYCWLLNKAEKGFKTFRVVKILEESINV